MAERSTKVIWIDPQNPGHAELEAAAQILRAGGLVAFPTETVYGLGANALDPAAIRGIFAAKGRPARNPLIIHVSDQEMLRGLIADWPVKAARLAAKFWPGPLTFVLHKAEAVPAVVTGGGPTVAVRMPKHPVALGLIAAVAFPLAAPSANLSAQLSPTTAEHVLEGLAGRIDLILDGGATLNGIESTVLDLTRDPPMLLRPGPISIAQLEAVIGPIVSSKTAPTTGALPSPGMLARHYSPRTPVELFANRDLLLTRAAQLRSGGEHVACMTLGELPAAAGVALPARPEQYAARLYQALHDLDRDGFSRILIELPPDTEDWLAVRDRLARAAG